MPTSLERVVFAPNSAVRRDDPRFRGSTENLRGLGRSNRSVARRRDAPGSRPRFVPLIRVACRQVRHRRACQHCL